jgi:hypothetical protein
MTSSSGVSTAPRGTPRCGQGQRAVSRRHDVECDLPARGSREETRRRVLEAVLARRGAYAASIRRYLACGWSSVRARRRVPGRRSPSTPTHVDDSAVCRIAFDVDEVRGPSTFHDLS